MAKAPTYFQERKDFLGRMIQDHSQIKWRVEMAHTKKIFSEWPIDFLANVAPPFQPMNSVAYFLGAKGKEYLQRELHKFNFKPEVIESVEQKEKVGEDAAVKTVQSIRQFLNE